MKHTLTLALFAASFPALAQITIGPLDMPSAGDTVRYKTDTPTTFDAADTGPGHVWDYSMLVPQGEGADTAVTVGSTPLLYQLFFNNIIIYPDWVANYAMKGTGIDIAGQLQIENLYDYYKKGSTGFRNVGFGATINSLPTSVQRDPVDWIFRFPMDYGNVDSSFSTWNVTVPTVLYFGEEQWRRNNVDGWGTLYLPTDTFEVLRVESRITRSDSLYVDQFGFGFQLPAIETIEYKWVAQGMDEPVLTITTVAGTPNAIRFYFDEQALSIGETVTSRNEGLLHLMPNPADDQFWLAVPEDALAASILDAEGRVVLRIAIGAKRGSLPIDVSSLASGLYTVQVAGKGSLRTGRLSVQH